MSLIHAEQGMIRAGAKFSTDRTYRYALWRAVPYSYEVSVRPIIYVGVNPSVADETTDDPTIRKCWGFALRELGGYMIMLNLFAYRTPYVERLGQVNNPVGPGNNRAIVHYIKTPVPPLIIACWGSYDKCEGMYNRAREVTALIDAHIDGQIMCFGQNQDGSPKHPLYLAADTPLVPFTLE